MSMTEEEMREIKRRSVIHGPTAVDVSKLILEIKRLKEVERYLLEDLKRLMGIEK